MLPTSMWWVEGLHCNYCEYNDAYRHGVVPGRGGWSRRGVSVALGGRRPGGGRATTARGGISGVKVRKML